MEEARIKMVGDASWARENVISSLVRLVREDGLLSSFSGLPAMLAKQIPYTMGKQVSFDVFAQILYVLAAQMAVSHADAKWAISVSAAFLASVVACITSQPGDMILTATYKGGHGGHGPSAGVDDTLGGSKDFATIVSGIYRRHGLAGFFFGLPARMAHVASIITSQLVAYDLIKMGLGLPVTGSH
jgi:solute carrier family 25 phosphate transporter 3